MHFAPGHQVALAAEHAVRSGLCRPAQACGLQASVDGRCGRVRVQAAAHGRQGWRSRFACRSQHRQGQAKAKSEQEWDEDASREIAAKACAAMHRNSFASRAFRSRESRCRGCAGFLHCQCRIAAHFPRAGWRRDAGGDAASDAEAGSALAHGVFWHAGERRPAAAHEQHKAWRIRACRSLSVTCMQPPRLLAPAACLLGGHPAGHRMPPAPQAADRAAI